MKVLVRLTNSVVFALSISGALAQAPEAAPPAAREPDVQVADILPIIIDPATNGGQTWITVHNPGKAERDVTLQARAFAHTRSKTQLAAQAALMGAAETSGAPVYIAKVKPGVPLPIKLVVSGYRAIGESVAQVEVDGRAHPVRARLYGAPFNVSLLAETPNKPKLAFTRGKTGSITLKNDDAFNYLVQWCMFLPDTGAFVGGTKLVPAKSTKPVQVDPPSAWFTHWFEGLFKNQQRDGTISLRLVETDTADPECRAARPAVEQKAVGPAQVTTSVMEPDAAFPAKTLPVQLELGYWDEGKRVYGYLILLSILIVGAVLSMMFNWWIPNFSRRDDLKARLRMLEEDTRRIRKDSDSRLRVIVRVLRNQLQKSLQALWLTSLDAGDRLNDAQKAVDLLAKRVAYGGELSEAEERVREMRRWNDISVLSGLDAVTRPLNEARHVLYKPVLTDDELLAAKGFIDAASKTFPESGKQDAELAGRLVRRLDELKKEFDAATGTTGNSKYGKAFIQSNASLVAILDDKRFATAADIRAEHYGGLEIAVALLLEMQNFIRLANGIDANNKASTQDQEGADLIKALQPEMIEALRRSGYEAVAAARLVVRQLEERVTIAQVEAALARKDVEVKWEPVTVGSHEPVRMKVALKDPKLERSSARNAFGCEWLFVPKVGNETGWTIAHYFRAPASAESRWKNRLARIWKRGKPGAAAAPPGGGATPPETDFSVRFWKPDGTLVQDSASNNPVAITPNPPLTLSPWMKSPYSDKSKVEFMRLVLAMLFAIIGLIAGAYEQFMKLDIFFGLLAVLALGFGADTIKNLFVKKT